MDDVIIFQYSILRCIVNSIYSLVIFLWVVPFLWVQLKLQQNKKLFHFPLNSDQKTAKASIFHQIWILIMWLSYNIPFKGILDTQAMVFWNFHMLCHCMRLTLQTSAKVFDYPSNFPGNWKCRHLAFFLYFDDGTILKCSLTLCISKKTHNFYDFSRVVLLLATIPTIRYKILWLFFTFNPKIAWDCLINICFTGVLETQFMVYWYSQGLCHCMNLTLQPNTFLLPLELYLLNCKKAIICNYI